ncbi:hypothetical protein XENOCAPTIV_013569 [Xenoophorus captivus]|uniref:Secreted protein n=1 Tax=Xenoophorus captivus TaxID=1517983 RepID=A0ABV0R8Y8_9TELE
MLGAAPLFCIFVPLLQLLLKLELLVLNRWLDIRGTCTLPVKSFRTPFSFNGVLYVYDYLHLTQMQTGRSRLVKLERLNKYTKTCRYEEAVAGRINQQRTNRAEEFM